MSETKIGPGKIETVAPDTTELQNMQGESSLPATRQAAAVAGTFHSLPGFVIPPSYMRIAYGVGSLADKNFPNGALVLDDTTKIANMKEPLTFIAYGASEFYKTWMTQAEYQAGIDAKIYPTREAAVLAGETVEWINGKGPSVAPAMELLMLIKKPAGCDSAEQFILKLGGEFYAPVRFTMDKYLYQDVSAFFHRVRFYEAGLRGVPHEEGRLDRWFLTLNTYSTKNKVGNYITHLSANYLLEGGAKVEVPPSVMEDLKAIGIKASAESARGASVEDEAPPVADEV